MSSKKAEARERVKAMREEQARRDRRRERTMRFGVAGAVVAAVAIIAIAVAASRGGDGPVAVPEAAAAGNGQEVGSDSQGILIGDASAPVTIDYWMDFLCPHCKDFHDTNGAAIDQLVQAGDANIVYHPVTYTGGVYSTRANQAFACAADEGKSNEFIDAAFASQGTQWSTSQLVDLGEQIGVGGDYESCVQDDTYEDWSSNVEDAAQDYQVTGTPTVFLNGELLPRTSQTPDGITSAVQTVAEGGEIATQQPEGTQPPAGEQTGGAGEQPSAQPTQ